MHRLLNYLLLDLWDHCSTLDDEDEPDDSRHRHFLSDVGSGGQGWQCECQEAIWGVRLNSFNFKQIISIYKLHVKGNIFVQLLTASLCEGKNYEI